MRFSACHLLCVMAWMLLVSPAFCTSFSTPENQIARSIAECFIEYHGKHGEWPDKWSELDESFGRSLDEYFDYAPPSKRYTFVKGVRLSTPPDAKLLMVMRKPTYEISLSDMLLVGLKGPGRYLIFEKPGGSVSYAWVDEEHVSRIFAEENQSLPMADHEPETPSIQAVRKKIFWRRAIGALVVLVPLAAFVGWRLALRRNAKKRLRTNPSLPDTLS